MKNVSRGRETRDRRSFRRQSRRFLVSTLTPRHSPRYATLSRFISSSLGSSLRSGTRHEGTLLASVWSLTAPFPRYARHSLRPYVSDGPSTRPDPTLIPALFPRFTRPLVGPVASRAPCRAGPSSREPATAARLHLPRSARRVGGTCGGRNESVTRPFAALRRNRAVRRSSFGLTPHPFLPRPAGSSRNGPYPPRSASLRFPPVSHSVRSLPPPDPCPSGPLHSPHAPRFPCLLVTFVAVKRPRLGHRHPLSAVSLGAPHGLRPGRRPRRVSPLDSPPYHPPRSSLRSCHSPLVVGAVRYAEPGSRRPPHHTPVGRRIGGPAGLRRMGVW